jgi:hypothetical protein
MKWLKKVAVTPLERVAKVIDNVAEQVNDRFNAPSIHAVREYINDNLLTIYPVGSIYLSANPDDPGLIFGGTWERIKDRFLLGVGDTYDTALETGGEISHTLVEAEIPQHRHAFTYQSAEPVADQGNQGYVVTSRSANYTPKFQNDTTGYFGGSQAHNNMPPYLTVYMWRRTA